MKHLIWLLLLVCSIGAIAQEDDLPPPSPKVKKGEGDWKAAEEPPKPNDFKPFSKKKKLDLSKFIIEPNFNLSFGNGRFDAGVSPYVGYQVWAPKNAKSGSMQGLYAGGGVTYYYTGLQHYDGPFYLKYNFQTYGGGVFLQYNIWRGFFARTKLELLNRRIPESYDVYMNPLNNSYRIQYNYKNVFVPALLVGVGYNLLQSRNFFFPIMISYNVLHSVIDRNYSLYPRGVVMQLGFINLF